MRLLTVSVLVTACEREGPDRSDGQTPPAPPSAATPTVVVDVTTLPNVWSSSNDDILIAVTLLGDATGDGSVDVAVQAQEPETLAYTTYLVAGPLRRSMTFPGDEFAVVPRAGVNTVGDATGDGVIDIEFTDWDYDSILVAGPFSGEVDVVATGTPLDFGLIEANEDGILDKWASGSFGAAEDAVHFTWGPQSRWGGVADVVIAPHCDGYESYEWIVDSPEVWEDVTGDGVRELWIEAYGMYSECGGYLMPLPDAGRVDPETTAGVGRGVPPLFEVVSDQTGDGLADVYARAGGKRIVAAPISVTDGWLTSTVEIAFDWGGEQYLRPHDLDFDDDGIADFLALHEELLFVPSGGFALAELTYATVDDNGVAPVWDLAEGRLSMGPILEDGTGIVFVEWDDGVVVVDLGPAALVH